MRAQSALSNNKRHRTLKYNVKVLDKYQETRKPILMQPTKTAKSKPPTATSTILDFKTNNDIIVRPSTTQINRVRIPMNMQIFMKKMRKLQVEEKKIEFQDQYSEVVKKMQVTDTTTPQEWIAEFVRNQRSHSAAITIQKAWRSYYIRKKWGGVFHKRIWSRRDALLRIFIGWRGAACDNFSKKYNLYERFYKLQSEKPWLSNKTNLCPWFLFYITNKWFYPRLYNARTYAYIVRVFAKPTMKMIFRLWRQVTKSQIGFRTHSISFLFTMKKRNAFGFAFVALILWHRYTKWKKLSKERQGAFSLNSSEFVIDWHVREKALNFKKARKTRANEHFIHMLKKRAHMAIHQNLVERRQYIADLEASHQFYMHMLLETGKKAWLKFIDIKKHKNQNLLMLQRGWYTAAYESAKKKHSSKAIGLYHQIGIKSVFFEAWRKITHISELQVMTAAYKLHTNPGLARHAAFKLLKHDEQITFENSINEWISYTKRRRAFKTFYEMFTHRDDERIIKQIAFYSLKRAADHKIIRRLVHNQGSFFPYQTWISLEGLSRDFELFKEDKEKFRFLTEMKPVTSDLDKFILLIVMFLDKQKHYDRAKFSTQPKKVEKKQIFTIIPLEQLKKLYKEACIKKMKIMQVKLHRDNLIILNVDSYRAALNYQELNPEFTVAEEKGIALPAYLTKIPEEMVFSDDILPSLNEFMKEIKESKFILPPKLHSIIVQERKNFNNKMRHPTLIYGAPRETKKEQQNNSALQNQAQNKRKEGRVVLEPFIRPEKQTNIPFLHPSLDCVKQLAHGSELKNFMNSSLIDLHSTLELSIFINKLEKGDYANNLRRFFLATSRIKIDVKPQEEENLSPSIKRQHRRNVATFVAGLCGIDASQSVPVSIEKPKWVDDYVHAIIGAFKEIKKFPSLAIYCGDTSFPTKLPIDSDEAVDLRNYIKMAITKKYGKLSKKETTLRKTTDSDEFCQQDLYIAMFALPYIIKPEYVRDFLKEEIKIDK